MKSFTQDLSEMEQLVTFLEEDLDNINRVIKYCKKNSLNIEFEVHAKAETCKESVKHSNIEISKIIKTLVFIGDEAFAVLCPGDKRVDLSKLSEIVDSDVRMATPEEVKEETQYIVGGVSPFDLEIPIYVAEEITEHDKVRPAAGSRAIGAKISPEELINTIGAQIENLTE